MSINLPIYILQKKILLQSAFLPLFDSTTFDIPVPGRPRDHHQSILRARKPPEQCWIHVIGPSGDLVKPRGKARGRRGYSLDGRGRCFQLVLAALYAPPEPCPAYSTSGTPPWQCCYIIIMQGYAVLVCADRSKKNCIS